MAEQEQKGAAAGADDDQEPGEGGSSGKDGDSASPFWGGVLLLLIAVGGFFAVKYTLWQATPHKPKSDGYLDVIFANRLIVTAARLVLISLATVVLMAAVYAVFVIGSLLGRKELPLRIWKVEFADRVRQEHELEMQQTVNQLQTALAENERLGEQLDRMQSAMRRLAREYDASQSGSGST